ncbi:MAG: ribonuclease P protein component [Clostridia bacterium]|nr:ribonuclease P protein component [Clostridia bacterium]
MLKRQQRICKNTEFRRVYRTGKVIPGKFMVLFNKKNGGNTTRFGFSVSKKVGNSVVRNRIRRLMREICRKHNDNIGDGYDIVLVARAAAKGRNFWQMEKDFIKITKRAGLYREIEIG